MRDVNHLISSPKHQVPLADFVQAIVVRLSLLLSIFIIAWGWFLGKGKVSKAKSTDFATQITEFTGQVYAYHRDSIVPNLKTRYQYLK